MINFDVRIIMIVVAILSCILGLHFLHLRKTTDGINSPFYWAIGSFANSACLLFISFFPWPNEIINLILFNLFVIAGQCFYLKGIWDFKNKKTNYLVIIALPVITIVQVLFFTLIKDEPGIRITINSIIYAVWAFYGFYEMITPQEKAYRFVFRVNAFLFFIFGSLMLVRAVLMNRFSPTDFITVTPIRLTLFTFITCLMVLLGYGFIIMLHAKLAEDLNKQLSVRQKLLSIIGHDLKSSINIIGGFSDLLNRNLDKLEIDKSKQFAGYIKQSSIQMNSLLTNLLDWAKLQGKNAVFYPEELNLKEICDDEISFNLAIAQNKQINVDFEEVLPIKVMSDRNMLKTILRNLLINAIKFTNKGGTIKVSSKIVENFAEVSVTDSGIGIEPQILSKLFKSDEQISTEGTAKETGSGLGLILCKEFVQKIGGKIWVESQVEKGSTFRFTVPLK